LNKAFKKTVVDFLILRSIPLISVFEMNATEASARSNCRVSR